MYEVYLLIGSEIVADIKFKSITQVCYFVADCNLDLLNVEIYSPKNKFIDPYILKEIWNA